MGDTDVFNFYSPPERQEPEGYCCPIPRSVRTKVFVFVHLFSGHRREGDLEWFLIRLGTVRRFRVAVISFDKAYGDQFDLGDDEVILDLVEKGREGTVHGVHNGAPCSIRSAARFAPGGLSPLRTRDSSWGLPGLSRKDGEHVDLHSKLLRGSSDVLDAVAAGGFGAQRAPRRPRPASLPVCLCEGDGAGRVLAALVYESEFPPMHGGSTVPEGHDAQWQLPQHGDVREHPEVPPRMARAPYRPRQRGQVLDEESSSLRTPRICAERWPRPSSTTSS